MCIQARRRRKTTNIEHFSIHVRYPGNSSGLSSQGLASQVERYRGSCRPNGIKPTINENKTLSYLIKLFVHFICVAQS